MGRYGILCPTLNGRQAFASALLLTSVTFGIVTPATITHAAPSDPWIDLTTLSLSEIDSPELSAEPIRQLPRNPQTHKFYQVMWAAEDCDCLEGLNPALVAAIAIHESGWYGATGFGITNGMGGYNSSYNTDASIQSFINLVSTARHYTGLV